MYSESCAGVNPCTVSHVMELIHCSESCVGVNPCTRKCVYSPQGGAITDVLVLIIRSQLDIKMRTKIVVCLLIVATVTVTAGASDAKASIGTTCVDQSQTVQYMVNTISNQSMELVKCNDNLQELQKTKSNQEEDYQRIYPIYKILKTRLESLSNILFFTPLVYNNKKYFVSKFPYQSATDAESYCEAMGGYLAEIDDLSEYKALQNLVLGLPVDLVLIGGSDSAVEGTWIFPRTRMTVPILDWIPGQPDNAQNDEDCLNLWKTHAGKMNDLRCGFRSSEDRFMCETPVLDSP
ncbi:hypothetical protein Btru_065473 [Bulinus truncatus]|nr:hypothetical protein Btru_065473 [Bulinus truncatus]